MVPEYTISFLVPITPLIWAAPAMFAYRQYEKDRYASVPVTLLGAIALVTLHGSQRSG